MEKFQAMVQEWFDEHSNWHYWHPLDQNLRLAEEVGEVSRVINHIYGEKPKKSSEAEQELALEIGDVVYTLVCMANSYGFDLVRPADLTQKPPRNLFAVLCSRCGRLSDAIETKRERCEISVRVNAVLAALASLAQAVSVDLDDAFLASFAKVCKRDEARF